jgi:hypothetical protein
VAVATEGEEVAEAAAAAEAGEEVVDEVGEANNEARTMSCP